MKRRISAMLALVLVAAMLVSFAGCSKEIDPKEEIINGTKATLAAFGQIGEQFGYEEIAKMVASGPIHQEMALYLSDANVGMDIRDFYGTGINMTADSSIPDRKMDIDMGLRVADYDALTLDMIYLDDGIYLACKELFDDYMFGITAEQIAAESGLDASAFNAFDIATKYIDENGKFKFSDNTAAGFKDAWTALLEASTWENPEKKATITAGADSGECDFYTMTIPAEAFKAFVVSAVDALLHDDYIVTIMESMAATTGASYEEEIAVLLEEMDAVMAETVTEPVAFEFAIMNKLLRQISTSFTVDGEVFDVSLTFGMGKNVADRIDLLINVAGGSIELVSEGNHVLSGGKFTDNTVFSVNAPGEPGLLEFEAETEYDTASGDYDWEMDAYFEGSNVELGMDGNLKIDKKTMDMVIDELYFNIMGMGASLNGSYHISESQNVPVDVSGAKMLMDLTEDEIGELEVLLNEKAYVLLMNIGQNVPAIGALIGF